MNLRKFFSCLLVAAVVCLSSCKNDEEPVKPSDGDYTGVVLNEICGENTEQKDWIELYNNSSVNVDLNGVTVVKTDEEGLDEVIANLPEGLVIEAGKYALIVQGDLMTGKISNSKQVGIALMSPSGNKTIDKFDRDANVGKDKGHPANGSYARVPNGTGSWMVVNTCTKGIENVQDTVSVDPPVVPPVTDEVDYTQLVLNELNGNDPKYIELYNKGTEEIDITGVQIKKDDEDIVYVAPEGTRIAAGAFLRLLSDQPDYSTGFSSGLSAKKSVMIELLEPDGTTRIDVFKNLKGDGSESWGEKSPKYNGEENGQSFGRYPDGTGKWMMMSPTEGTANTQGDTLIEW